MGKVQQQKDTANVEDLFDQGYQRAVGKFLVLSNEHRVAGPDVSIVRGVLLQSLASVYHQILHLHEIPKVQQINIINKKIRKT